MTYFSLPFALLCLAHLVAGASSNSTDTSCPPLDATSRSVWSILGSCGLTLLICVWHTLHPDVPKLGGDWPEIWLKRAAFVVSSFFAPEGVVARAGREWCRAHRKVKEFREQGYEWSMAHSHFATMEGFVYRDERGHSRTINADDFLRLCKAGRIADPLITERQIKDKSKSDAVGKAIFTLQLIWFGLQVVVRGSQGLAVTLVELDTVCMAMLALVYLIFWWDKPLRPDSPHVFCYSGDNTIYSQKELSNAWKSQPGFWNKFIARLFCVSKTSSIADVEGSSPESAHPGKLTTIMEAFAVDNVILSSLFVSWFVLGGLHLVAWNFEFPTETEKTIWRIASLVLAGSSPVMGLVVIITEYCENLGLEWVGRSMAYVVATSAIASRALLVGLMLASLRALPCSAHDTVSWTTYIPHL